ncbi:MAG: hypothetical protein NT070_20010 [Cyanobacteria bacterium]|nr:hypothetical protein [Cyanobacteriota bacterium]
MSPASPTIVTMLSAIVCIGAMNIISEFGRENLEPHQYNYTLTGNRLNVFKRLKAQS